MSQICVIPCCAYENPNQKPPPPCALAPHCGCHGFRAPTPEALARHEAEAGRRLAWCVRKGRLPAHEHVHEAPGDDSQFVYGVAPWLPDGRPNPPGVPYSPEDSILTAIAKTDSEAGWTCTRCHEWVPRAPRPFKGGVEPWDWWFCLDCKAKAVKPSQKVLKEQQVSAGCRRMDDFLKRRV